MANWTSETVVFYQKDGRTDRLEILYNLLNQMFNGTEFVTHTDKYGNHRELRKALIDSLAKWERDYPGTDYTPDNVEENWIGNVLPEMGLHHWYEQKGKEVTPEALVTFLVEVGVRSCINVEKRPFVKLYLSTRWTCVHELWDEMAKLYNLEYVQLAVEEAGGFQFNTDVHHEFIKERYFIEYYDDEEDLVDSQLVANKDDLLQFIDRYEYIDKFIDSLHDIDEEVIGNFSRSTEWQQMKEERFKVSKVVEGLNQFFKAQYEDDESYPEIVCSILDTKRNKEE